jgi:lipopolysaccharide biosynthesis glycosyltransferase
MYNVFIGWDPRDQEAAEVCRYTLLKHATLPVNVQFLRLDDLMAGKIYTRKDDPESSGQYTYLRYYIPHIMGHKGLAVYCDPGCVWLTDVRELFKEFDDRAAVHVVKHNYKPLADKKLDDKPQSQYRKKAWSSVMLINSGHESNKKLTADLVNKSSAQFLHQFEWLQNNDIWSLNPSWNWIPGLYKEPADGQPNLIHFTEGGPWLKDYQKIEYGYFYLQALQNYRASLQSPPLPGPYDNLPVDIQNFFDWILQWRVDPREQYYNLNLEKLINKMKTLDTKACVAVEAESVNESSDKLEAKGQDYDPFLKSFIIGSGGQISVWNKTDKEKIPVVLRGVTKRKQMDACRAADRDYYYIDTGYFGNGRKKLYHRITKNEMQNTGPVIHRPRDRLALTGYQARKFRPGRYILLAPPSQKLLMCFNIDLDTWLDETLQKIKICTDREVIVRNKQSRSVRQSTDTMEMALEKDIHCLVTFSSIAAVEAVLLGKPAITLGPSAAHAVTSHDIKDIEKPYIPTMDEVEEWAAHLAYCQFTEAEMRNGTAWKILNNT